MTRSTRTPEQIRLRDDRGWKYCIHCTVWLPESSFRDRPTAPDGLAPICRACDAAAARKWSKANRSKVRRAVVKRRYGLSPDQLNEMTSKQGGACAICGSDNTENGFGRLVIDHDQACCSGKKACGNCVRGLLCSTCNLGIGYMRDSPDLLFQAAHYLEEWSSSKP